MYETHSDPRRILLERYTLPIVHLRQQLYDPNRRLALFFGSGIGLDLGFPKWNELIDGVVHSLEQEGVEAPAEYASITYKTQILKQKFTRKRLADEDVKEIPDARNREAQINSEWRNILHRQLYKNSSTKNESILDTHPYLPQLLPVIKKSALVVNYNFDDSIERLIQKHRTAQEKSTTLGYESFWAPRLHVRTGRTPIYHPNGFLSANEHERHSDDIILAEGEFADQLTDFSSGNYQYLLNCISRNTCLLIGLSLDDGTLKNLLRQNAKSNPANLHYYIRFVGETEHLSEHEKRAIEDTNFEIYNLITLFMTKGDITNLAELLQMEPSQDGVDADQFEEVAKNLPSKFTFYLVGCVGSGKTTTLSYFRNTFVFDEWLEPRIPEIILPSNELNDQERETADEWVLRQVSMKNENLATKKSGIYFVDRAPLDAFAFTPQGEIRNKAKSIEDKVCGTNPRRPLEPGCVLFLKNDPDELETRMYARNRPAKAEYLEHQQKMLEGVYCGSGVMSVPTSNRSPLDVARDVARLVFQTSYEAFDFEERLKYIREKGTL